MRHDVSLSLPRLRARWVISPERIRRLALIYTTSEVTSPQALADLAKGQLRKKTAQLQQALAGTLQPHHRVVVTELLSQIDYLEEAIARLDAQITEVMAPFVVQIEHLDSIPGVSRRIAEVLIAEVGVDMTPFESAERLASWAGCAQGTMRAQVNASRARRAKAAPGCAVP